VTVSGTSHSRGWDFDGDCYDLTMFLVEELLATKTD